MALSISSSYYGMALYQLIDEKSSFKISTFPTQSNNSYSIDNKIGLHLKYSSKKQSPWQFNFTKQQQEELKIMYEMHEHTFLVFICGNDGITCIHYHELKKLLDEFYEDTEWIKLKRLSGQSYSASGKDGVLEYKLKANDYPKKVFELI